MDVTTYWILKYGIVFRLQNVKFALEFIAECWREAL